MAAEIEAVAVALDGARETADLRVGLEHDDRLAGAREHVAGGQSGRSGAEHGGGEVAVASHVGGTIT